MMQQPDSQSYFQNDCFAADECEPIQPFNPEGAQPLTPAQHPWFFDDELTAHEKLAAEVWAEQQNLYYYKI